MDKLSTAAHSSETVYSPPISSGNVSLIYSNHSAKITSKSEGLKGRLFASPLREPPEELNLQDLGLTAVATSQEISGGVDEEEVVVYPRRSSSDDVSRQMSEELDLNDRDLNYGQARTTQTTASPSPVQSVHNPKQHRPALSSSVLSTSSDSRSATSQSESNFCGSNSHGSELMSRFASLERRNSIAPLSRSPTPALSNSVSSPSRGGTPWSLPGSSRPQSPIAWPLSKQMGIIITQSLLRKTFVSPLRAIFNSPSPELQHDRFDALWLSALSPTPTPNQRGFKGKTNLGVQLTHSKTSRPDPNTLDGDTDSSGMKLLPPTLLRSRCQKRLPSSNTSPRTHTDLENSLGNST